MTKREQADEMLAWIRDNTGLFNEVVKVAQQGVEMGYKRWSIQAVFEVVRWERMRAKRLDSNDLVFALNNNLRPMLARWLMFKMFVPEDFFETRELRKEAA